MAEETTHVTLDLAARLLQQARNLLGFYGRPSSEATVKIQGPVVTITAPDITITFDVGTDEFYMHGKAFE